MEQMQFKKVLYAAPQNQFFDDVRHNRIKEMMQEEAKHTDVDPHMAELYSWPNNAPRIKDLLELCGVQNCHVSFEYLLPNSQKRIDCMIYGTDSQGKGHVVHLELKQWSNESVKALPVEANFSVDEGEEEGLEVFTGSARRNVPHPSQQVRGYQEYLTGFVDALQHNDPVAHGYAYCFNYTASKSPHKGLFSDRYSQLMKDYPTFAGDQVEELAAVLKKYLCGGKGLEVFNKVINSPIHTSQRIIDSAAAFVGKAQLSTYALIDDQILARNAVMDAIRSHETEKNVIIVKGGPGTGKTVIALHLLAAFAAKGKEVRYTTRSSSLINGLKHQLKGMPARQLLCGIGDFLPYKTQPNAYHLILVDEAHRLRNNANNQYTRKENKTDLTETEVIIRAAGTSVFFIDDLQAIRSSETTQSESIRAIAQKWHANVQTIDLYTQFRCNGSNQFVQWVDHVLYNRPIQEHLTHEEYEIRLLDNPHELYRLVCKVDQMQGKTSRLVAGYCWPWSETLNADGTPKKDVVIGDFAMPWETHLNLDKAPKGYVRWYEWAYLPEGIKQVGCIYTAQGFEFDYIGVIVGPDLVYRDGKIQADPSGTCDSMLKRGDANQYIRNIYRVLMTRGMRGCLLYVCDKPLREYLRTQIEKLYHTNPK